MSVIRTWLQLLRAPNLFTVAGDPLAGFMLAAFGIPSTELTYALGASLCFYSAGLLDNDLAGLREDRQERPNRPLPAGQAKPATVLLVALVLVAAGLGLCAAIDPRMLKLGLALVACIAAYNHGLKRIPVVGSLVMGACRSLSILLGAAAAPTGLINFPALSAAILTGLFIAAVTNLARFETRESSPSYAKWLPPLVLLLGIPLMFLWQPMGMGQMVLVVGLASKLLLAAAAALAFAIATKLAKASLPVPPAIGQFIRLLLPIQAAYCTHTGMFGVLGAVLLLGSWPLSRLAAKRFYAS